MNKYEEVTINKYLQNIPLDALGLFLFIFVDDVDVSFELDVVSTPVFDVVLLRLDDEDDDDVLLVDVPAIDVVLSLDCEIGRKLHVCREKS